MRAAFAIMMAASLFILFDHEPLHSQRYDIGVIESMSEGNIYVRGNHGLHELEILGTCLWCEVGIEVMVTFEGFTRATLSQYPKSATGKPVKTFIIKDGRDEAEMR
jgi:hypothetical protein